MHFLKLPLFKIFMPLIALGILPHQALSQETDMTRASCAQLMELKDNERQQLILWLQGYYAGAAQRGMIDAKQIQGSSKSFQEACQKNPKLPLIGADTRSLFLGVETQAQQNAPQRNQQSVPPNMMTIPDASSVQSPYGQRPGIPRAMQDGAYTTE